MGEQLKGVILRFLRVSLRAQGSKVEGTILENYILLKSCSKRVFKKFATAFGPIAPNPCAKGAHLWIFNKNC